MDRSRGDELWNYLNTQMTHDWTVEIIFLHETCFPLLSFRFCLIYEYGSYNLGTLTSQLTFFMLYEGLTWHNRWQISPWDKWYNISCLIERWVVFFLRIHPERAHRKHLVTITWDVIGQIFLSVTFETDVKQGQSDFFNRLKRCKHRTASCWCQWLQLMHVTAPHRATGV